MLSSCPNHGRHCRFPLFAANPRDDPPDGILYLTTFRVATVVQHTRGIGKYQYRKADDGHEGRNDKPECELSAHARTLPETT
jgi:hypothetical protein